MFIICEVSPDYNASDYSQYEPAPEPYTLMYLDGKWTRDFTEEDPGYTEEDFDRIVAEDDPGTDDTEYFLVSKIVTKLGTVSQKRIAEEEALINYMEEEVYLKRSRTRHSIEVHSIEVLGSEGPELHTIFAAIHYWQGKDRGFGYGLNSNASTAVKLPRWQAEGVIHDDREKNEGRNEYFQYEMCSEALLPTNEEIEALCIDT